MLPWREYTRDMVYSEAQSTAGVCKKNPTSGTLSPRVVILKKPPVFKFITTAAEEKMYVSRPLSYSIPPKLLEHCLDVVWTKH